jgi:cytochrome P450
VTVQQVLNESLRLYPTAPLIMRDIHHDTEIDGTVIPAGTIATIPIYAVHRHRSLWSDPDRFDPDRFAPDNPARPSRYQFMPFGAGPRICMGAAFAMMEATIMLATFVRAARFTYASQRAPVPCGRMFLLPRDGMFMRVALREGEA